MSFIDLMGSPWPDEHINRRVTSLIRSIVSEDDEAKAARLYRKPQPTVDELSFIRNVDSWIEKCVQEGKDARKDNLLLMQVIPFEEARRRLSQYALRDGKPAVTEMRPLIGEDGNPVYDNGNQVMEEVVIVPAIPPITQYLEDGSENPEWQLVLRDDEERRVAQEVVDGASSEVISVANLRAGK